MQDTASDLRQNLLEHPLENPLEDLAQIKLARLGLCQRFVSAGAREGFDMASHAGIVAWTVELRRRAKAAETPDRPI